MTSKSGEECTYGVKYKVNFEIECDINQLDPIVTENFFDKDDSYCFLNIHIKSRYGKLMKLILLFFYLFPTNKN